MVLESVINSLGERLLYIFVEDPTEWPLYVFMRVLNRLVLLLSRMIINVTVQDLESINWANFFFINFQPYSSLKADKMNQFVPIVIKKSI